MLDTDIENKFKSLIQPIKDLSLNWDIDIAEELEDYLEELDHLHITIDHGKTNLNFAEAALVIQGSAAIYSKKVEYLHQLVLQALELITSKSSKTNSNSSTTTAKAKHTSTSFADDERILFGSDPEYLLLDDVLEEGLNITLSLPEMNISNHDTNLSRRNSLSGDLSRASMILMHSLLHEDHGSSSLRLSTCRMNSDGALIIGQDILPQFSDISMIKSTRTSHSGLFLNQSITDKDLPHITNETQLLTADKMNVDDGTDDNHIYDDYISIYDNNQGNIDDDAHVSPFTSDVHVTDHINHLHTPTKDILYTHTNDDQNQSIITPTRTLRSQNNTNKVQHELSKKVTMLPLLDPHEPTNGSKELKKGHTYRIPPSLNHTKSGSNKHGNNKKSTNLKFQEKPLYYSIFDQLHNYTPNLVTNLSTSISLIHPEFHTIAIESKKKIRIDRLRRRKIKEIQEEQYLYQDPLDAMTQHQDHTILIHSYQNQQERQQSLHHQSTQPSDVLDIVDPLLAAQLIDEVEGEEDDDIYHDDGVYWNDADYPNDDDNEEDTSSGNKNVNIVSMNRSDNNDNHSRDPLNSDQVHIAEILDTHIKDDIHNHYSSSSSSSITKGNHNPFAMMFDEEEELTRRVEDVLNDTILPNHIDSYENLCRKHIKQFMDGAESYARETQLSKRVTEWTRRLEPILRQQEESAVFDIHEYADNVLTRVHSIIQYQSTSTTTTSTTTTATSSTIQSLTHTTDDDNSNDQDDMSHNNNNNIVDIDHITNGLSSAEVSRIFLACLQLANTGNIDIIREIDIMPSSHILNKSRRNSETAELRTSNELKPFKIQLLQDKRISALTKMDTFITASQDENQSPILLTLPPSMTDQASGDELVNQEKRDNVNIGRKKSKTLKKVAIKGQKENVF